MRDAAFRLLHRLFPRRFFDPREFLPPAGTEYVDGAAALSLLRGRGVNTDGLVWACAEIGFGGRILSAFGCQEYPRAGTPLTRIA